MNTPTNIASFLPELARQRPHGLAIVFPEGRSRAGRVLYSHYTFKQLDEQSSRVARGLQAVGIGRGVRTVLMVKPSLEFFALTFGLFKAGAVPVMVDPGIGVKALGTCLAEAEPKAFIGIPKAHLGRLVLGWARRSLETLVTVGRKGPWGGVSLDEVVRAGGEGKGTELAETRADETAAILFTSGSTGIPKGAVYTHGMFVAQVEAIGRTYGIRPGEIDLATFPLFALFDPALGMTAVIPDMDASRPASADPRKLVEAIEDFGITNMFGSPAVINRLGRHCEQHGIKLPTLRRVLSAGAPVSAEILERFSRALAPGVEIFTPYGATESLPVASIGSAEILGETRRKTEQGAGVCIGRPVEGVEVRIIGIDDGPIKTLGEARLLEAGEVGELAVHGPTTTQEYYARPASTELAKMRDEQGRVWHRMGDLGYFDPQGRLWYCGRKSHRVATKETTHFTDPCENVFNAHPAVYRTALVGVERGGQVEPVLCVELDEASRSASLEAVRRELLALGAACPKTAAVREILFHPGLPVDIRHNAKIFREKLAVWAKQRLS